MGVGSIITAVKKQTRGGQLSWGLRTKVGDEAEEPGDAQHGEQAVAQRGRIHRLQRGVRLPPHCAAVPKHPVRDDACGCTRVVPTSEKENVNGPRQTFIAIH